MEKNPEDFDLQQLAALLTPEEHLRKLLSIVRAGQDFGSLLNTSNFYRRPLELRAGLAAISQLSQVFRLLRPGLQPLFPEINWNGIVRIKHLSNPVYYRVRRWWTLNILQNFLLQIEAQIERRLAVGYSNVASANG